MSEIVKVHPVETLDDFIGQVQAWLPEEQQREAWASSLREGMARAASQWSVIWSEFVAQLLTVVAERYADEDSEERGLLLLAAGYHRGQCGDSQPLVQQAQALMERHKRTTFAAGLDGSQGALAQATAIGKHHCCQLAFVAALHNGAEVVGGTYYLLGQDEGRRRAPMSRHEVAEFLGELLKGAAGVA
jgi:hypothetical protein